MGDSVLPHWLGLNSEQTINGLISALEKGDGRSKKPGAAAAPEPLNEPLSDDDEWDQEDIDEIQGKHLKLLETFNCVA